MHALNETGRQLLREGVPVQRDDLLRQPLETLTGEAVTPADLPLLKAWREGASQETTFVQRKTGGSGQLLSWTVAPLRGTDGALQGVTGTLVVTAPEPDWHELAALAHDMRTPLQTLRLLVPLLEAMPIMHPDAMQALERIRSASERAMGLGLDLVEWCRHPTQGARRVERNWLALGPFLTALVAEQAPVAQRKGLTLSADVAAAQGWEVHTDRGRLGRLLGNLLSNGVRYTNAGQVRLSASWREERGKLAFLVLTVTDTGAGIAPEEEESIFQPYERGKAGKEGDSGGSGLGLSVVDRLVNELELTLEVYSEYGAGSTFDLLLPRASLRQGQGRQGG